MNKLKEARERHGASQQQMGDLLQVTRQRYHQIETNPDRARVEQVKKICNFLHEDPRRIFFD